MLSIGKAASAIGVSIPILRRWEKKGIIMPYRTPGNHRRYPLDQIEKILSKNNKNEENKNVLGAKTAENNHLNKLIESKIIRKFTIEIDPAYIDTRFIYTFIIKTTKTGNKELDKVSTKAFAFYLLENHEEKIVFMSIDFNKDIMLICQFTSENDFEDFRNGINVANHFIESSEIIENSEILAGSKLFLNMQNLT
ncbi:MAG: MerR family transcriptional regulator [Promethearchaeota archaeon]